MFAVGGAMLHQGVVIVGGTAAGVLISARPVPDAPIPAPKRPTYDVSLFRRRRVP